MTCTHERIAHIGGKTSDMQTVSVPHLGLEHEGGGVFIGAICGGDYIELKLCLDCGHALNFGKPMTDEEITEAFEDAC